MLGIQFLKVSDKSIRFFADVNWVEDTNLEKRTLNAFASYNRYMFELCLSRDYSAVVTDTIKLC
jgi:hypothetical protein